MTFLATIEGELVGGIPSGDPRGWPRPWAFRCDGCGATLPYGCVLVAAERRTSFAQARLDGGDRHLCAACDGFAEQIAMGLA